MTRFEKWSIAALLYTTTCLACARPTLVPMTWRPDTRNIWVVHIDTTTFRKSLEIFQAALPNEAAVCYAGVLRDTTFELEDGPPHVAQILDLTDVSPAKPDSADLYHVYFAARPRSGCLSPIAIGHSHPYASECDQSNDDVNVVFMDTRALVAFVWCANGEMQMLFQDGRRKVERWRG